MRIRDVDLPREVLSAQEAQRLVVFAGAGVSMAAPANYPSFIALADQVAQAAGIAGGRPENEPIDRFLGRLSRSDVNVHGTVRASLSVPSSRPTKVHLGLVSLYRLADAVRIVTTNFDTHFTAAVEAVHGRPVPIFRAPALPVARRFRGIVHLHGCVDQDDPRDLVLTDDDFGRAYLTEGWATRFLMDLFAAYTVLFVGYSHNDPILQYLARGLPPNTSRFVLTQEGLSAHWNWLGVSEILFPLRNGDDRYAALPEAIDAWARLTRMDALDHEQHLKAILERPPGLDLEDNDYVAKSLKSVTSTRFFVRHARGVEWLNWLHGRGLLDRLFGREETEDQATRELAWWVAEQFVSHGYAAFSVIQKQSGPMGAVLWTAVARQLAFVQELPPPPVLATWVGLLLRSPLHRPGADLLLQVLARCRLPDDRHTALVLLDALLRSEIALRPQFGYSEGTEEPDVEVVLSPPARKYELAEAWEKLRPQIAGFAIDLVPVLSSALGQAHTWLSAVGSARDQWDPVSWRRAAIEPHEQDSTPGDLDPLIDMARDVLEHLTTAAPTTARRVIADWSTANAPILRRLAVHGVTVSRSAGPDTKIRWLLKNSQLYSASLKHEVFRLLSVTYPSATAPVRQRLLQAAVKGPRRNRHGRGSRRTRDYEVYNLLAWLVRVAPDCPDARRAFEHAQAAHSDFEPRDHPDFNSYMWSGSFERKSPLTPAELLAEPASAHLKVLFHFRGEAIDGPSREGLLAAVGEATASSFEWGRGLAESLLASDRVTGDLWEAVLGAWRGSSLTREQWADAFGLLHRVPNVAQLGDEIADLLVAFADDRRVALDKSSLPEATALAERLGPSMGPIAEGALEAGPPDDWFYRAINSVGGKVAQFWLHTLARVREEAGDSWSGLPDQYSAALDAFVLGESLAAAFGRTYLASQLAFLFGVDREWTRTRLLPLLDWSRDRRIAREAWTGYLTWGKWSEGFLAEILPQYEGTYPELHELPQDLRPRFHGHIASIAIHSSRRPLDDGWLTRYIAAVPDADRRAWAEWVRRALADLADDAKTAVWNDWLRDYWSQRLGGVPLSLGRGEAAVMAEWTLELVPVYPEAVQLTVGGPVPEPVGSRFYRKLRGGALGEQYPDKTADLLRHTLRGEGDSFYWCRDAKTIKDTVSQRGARAQAERALSSELARLGCM